MGESDQSHYAGRKIVERCSALGCHRQAHVAPQDVDKRLLCLIHSRDEHKDVDQFSREFDSMLPRAGGDVDCSDFVFPRDFPVPKEFNARPNFESAIFLGDVDFHKVTFQFGAIFNLVHFEGRVQFDRCIFAGVASFDYALFAGPTSFEKTVFNGAAQFNHAHLPGFVDFSNTQFLAAAEFRETLFAGARERETYPPCLPGPVFSRAAFAKPELVIFYKCYLGQALFHNCDVSRFVFSDVTWRRRAANGKRMVFEEDINLV